MVSDDILSALDSVLGDSDSEYVSSEELDCSENNYSSTNNF